MDWLTSKTATLTLTVNGVASTVANANTKTQAITAAQLGTADVVDLKIAVDKTYVPAVITNGANRDPRELGVRVFHAYIQPKG